MRDCKHVKVKVHFPCCDNELTIRVPIMKRRFPVICYRCWLAFDGYSEDGVFHPEGSMIWLQHFKVSEYREGGRCGKEKLRKPGQGHNKGGHRENYFCQGLTEEDFRTLARFHIEKTEILGWVGLPGRELSGELQTIIESLIENPEFDKRSRVLMVLINLQGSCLDNPDSLFDVTEEPAGKLTPIFPPAAIPKYGILPVEKNPKKG